MRRSVAIAHVVLLLVAASTPQVWGARPSLQEARVSWVTDGDTITVSLDGKSAKVRLVGIDAPEIHDEREPWRARAREAAEYLRKQIKGRTVTLETDGIQRDRDDYGRLLRYVYLEGRNLNLELVRLGYARVYRRFGARLKTELLAAETEAKSKKLGIWSLPPGPFRVTR